MPKKLKVFLDPVRGVASNGVDTSAILAGFNSPTGAAGVILAACFAGKIAPIVSLQVIKEVNRNIPVKFPKLAAAWASFLLLPPKIIPDPTLTQVKKAYAILPTSDAPILAAAIKAKPDAFVTWDTRHFLRAAVMDAVNLPIITPGDFLNKFLRT